MDPEDVIGMNFVALDIEGSGGNVRRDSYGTGSVVSLGAVDFNTKEEFYEECRVMDGRGYDSQALLINGFTKEQIFDTKKQSVLELLVKFEDFCKAHGSKLIGAWGMYDLKMLIASYGYYSRNWELPYSYLNLKSVSKIMLGNARPGLSNTAIKLGMQAEQMPHTGMSGARLATENASVLLFGSHYYGSYSACPIPLLKLVPSKLPVTKVHLK